MKVGQKVLVLLPIIANKLLMHWKGPFSIVEKMGDLDYKIDMRGRIQMFHVNMLKLYVEREPTNLFISSPEHKVSFVATVSVINLENEDTDGVDIANETLRDVHINEALEPKEIVKVQCQIFQHDIKLTSDGPVRFEPYPIPYAMLETANKEVNKMIEIDIIERSGNPYLSLFVIVKKKDLSNRFCIDFRGLNSITIFDAETMGYIVGTDRLSPNQDKIEVIKDAHRPTTKKQVRRFIGMAEFYRKFVPNFTDIASPLTDLTKKNETTKSVTSFITLIFKSVDGDFIKMTERKELRNKHLQGNLVKSLTTETSIECFRQCNKLKQCSSMSYNPQNKICYMYSGFNTYSDGTLDNGRMYYLKDVNNCLTEEGYSYKSNVMLCLKFYNVKVMYHEAVSTCQSQNASLVRIDSQEKQNVLYSFLVDDEQFAKGHVYLQGMRTQNTSEWEFDDGTPITYLPWNRGQPEAYDQIYLCLLAQDQGLWHDCIGTQLFGFVCERNLF
ncbi:unnamed protein product [Mytilus coruscus]|uniref:C-type lectin domain-containing protein n=1 Tax=Mytilus coruscus TaxID=42192 RepID=A0A6J8AIY1_MYTCO|nr:unnamed protein product [Mytilus coruscus]